MGADTDIVDIAKKKHTALSQIGAVGWLVASLVRAVGHDGFAAAAAAQTVPALPTICQSPGIDFAVAESLLSARIQRRARRNGNATEPRGYRVRSDKKMNYLITEGRKSVTLAWASRPAPGGIYIADVADGRVLIRADQAPESDRVTAALQQHASAISPSRWHITPQLVFAHSTSASITQLRSLFHDLDLLLKS